MRPYLATIPPMNPSACVPVCRGLAWSLVAGFNDNVRALATAEAFPLVDVYQGFNGILGCSDLTDFIRRPKGTRRSRICFSRRSSRRSKCLRRLPP
jgi:hypothetical protein